MSSPTTPATPNRMTSVQVYALAVICFVVGITLGYLVRGSASKAPQGVAQHLHADGTPHIEGEDHGAPAQNMGPGQLRQMPEPNPAEAAAEAVKPALEQLQKDPKNFDLLLKVANTYYEHKAFKESVDYYEKALAVKPDSADVLVGQGSAFFYLGDADNALKRFETALKHKPGYHKALFNMGIVRWQAKKDPAGAVAAWQELINKNPDHPMRAEVEDWIERAKAHSKMGKKS